MSKALQIGFEFEFRHVLSNKEICRQISLMFPDEEFETSNSTGTSFNPYVFHIKKELGLYRSGSFAERDEKELKNSCEIATPIWSQTVAIQNFKKILTWLKYTGAQTYRSCGIHVNISFKNIIENSKISPVKLVLLHNDTEILETFDRTTNYHCECVYPLIDKWLKKAEFYQQNYIKDRILQKIKVHLLGKGHSIRFSEDLINRIFDPSEDDNCYVEFRSLGGRNYQYREKELLIGVRKFIDAIKMSADSNTDTQLCNKIRCLQRKWIKTTSNA